MDVNMDKENQILSDIFDDLEDDEELLDEQGILDQIERDAEDISMDLLPEKSKARYMLAYSNFMEWKKQQKIGEGCFSEAVLLVYFNFLKSTLCPSTMWTRYSMLKSVIQSKHNLKIEYAKLIALLKKYAIGYRAKKAKVFRPEEIQRFLSEANDHQYLAAKVIIIFGIYGATRAIELTKCDVKHVKAEGEVFLVDIPDTKNNVRRKFCVDVDYARYVRKYINLRPKNVGNTRFFVNYQNGKCTIQPIGRNKFLGTPKLVADFLRLEDACLYTGHSLRRTSTTLLANAGANIMMIQTHGGWNSDKTAKGYVDDSVTNKEIVGDMITRQIQKKAKMTVTSTVTSSQVVSIKGQEMVSSAAILSDRNCVDAEGTSKHMPVKIGDSENHVVSIKEQGMAPSSTILSERNCVERDIDAIRKHMPVKIRDCDNVTINFNFK